ncbi:MAG: four helix bundle protein [Deltaproteobacteria bacterium]|nr:four helix bundle protein [Deltaproteobacteria bacterium]
MHFRLHVLENALRAVTLLRPIVTKIRKHDKNLAEELRDAANSMVLNIGEAGYSDPGNQRARISTASGSTNECRTSLKLAHAWGYAAEAETTGADTELDLVAAKLFRLLNPR